MKNLIFLLILYLNQIGNSQSIGSLEGYSYLPLTNPRFTDGSHIPNYSPPSAAIDGQTNSPISATSNNVQFFVDLTFPRPRVDKIKTYPSRCCGYQIHSYFNIYTVDQAGQSWHCTTDQPLYKNLIHKYFETGVVWDCPIDQVGQEDIVSLRIQGGGQTIAFTEIEAFGNPFTNFYQPENLVLRNYAPDLLSQFVNRSNIISDDADEITNKLLSHGCWCAKLDKHNPYLEFLGGPDPVDELDELCKNWFKCRNCNDRLTGGSCNVLGVNSNELLKARSYTLEEDPAENFIDTVHCVVNSESPDACADETCSIDILYLKDIYNYLEENFDSQSQA